MTCILSTTVRDPDSPMEVYRVFVGQQTEAHDGTLLTDYTAEKLGWRLNWTLLTSSERSTLVTQAEIRTSMTFQPPTGTATYSVMVKADTLKEEATYSKSGTIYYAVSFDVEEVA